jgi:polygalacturonase
MTRRELLRAGVSLLAMPPDMLRADAPTPQSVLARIKAPEFPNREFEITRYGAVAGGKTKCTEAIAKAIVECNAAGGGRVVIPPGRFLTGAVHLLDNVNLHVRGGAVLAFSSDPKDYPTVLTRYEGIECMNYSPFIYAFRKNNVAVTGPGTIDGQASLEHWWPWTGRAHAGWKQGQPNGISDRKTLGKMGESGVPVEKRIFGEGHYLRPAFVQPYRCNKILLEGFTVVNSPMWELNPVLCENVTVRNVNIQSYGPNNDGCDPESCRDVLIEGCTFSTGDDCIAVKSGRNRDGRRVGAPCENVLIRNCHMKDGHGGVSIGSEVSGGVRNIFVDRCRMSSPNLERGLRIKTNSYRGGVIQNIRFENVTIGQVKEAAVEVDFYYEEGPGGPFRPRVEDIYIANVTSEKSTYGIFLRGFPNAPISGVTIVHCNFKDAEKGNLFQNVQHIDVKDVLVNGKPITLAGGAGSAPAGVISRSNK